MGPEFSDVKLEMMQTEEELIKRKAWQNLSDQQGGCSDISSQGKGKT
jgi:hypothetical protein